MKEVEQDIEIASKIIENKKLSQQDKELYSKIYQTQSENSRILYPKFSPHWENSLFIGGSGDQAINSILYGSRNITIIDKNPLAIHYIALRIASLKGLNNQEFLNFFFSNKDNDLSKVLSKIYPYLDEKDWHFWISLLENYSKQEIIENLFHYNFTNSENQYLKEAIIHKNPFLEKKYYNYLKKILTRTKISLQNQTLEDFALNPEITNFDKIYLSNIFLDLDLSLEEYNNFLNKKIFPLLSENGDAMVGYLNINSFQDATIASLGTSQEIIEFFKEKNYQIEQVSEIQNYGSLNTAFIFQKKRDIN